MKLSKDYFKLQEEIYDYFGYREDWVVIPIEDATEYNWMLHGEKVWFSNKSFTIEMITNGDYLFSNTIYRQRFLNKFIYRKKDYTMICVDTHTDGNKFLQVFDNSKEFMMTDEQLNATKLWNF